MRGATCPWIDKPCPDYISIHAPRAGRDTQDKDGNGQVGISIHAPRAGRDRAASASSLTYGNFNPRAPCGARLLTVITNIITQVVFQSTRPVRGATEANLEAKGPGLFQSTRPVRGATYKTERDRVKM